MSVARSPHDSARSVPLRPVLREVAPGYTDAVDAASPHARADLLAGRFRLDTVLGRGGMATVWSAHDTRLDRTVAVKILHEHLSDEDAARVEREARAAARIADPRVVTVLDLDHAEDGTPFLVFEALSGRTLGDEIRERGALAPERVERLADDLLGALAAAHECGVLHRDIKPSNVLVDGDGFRITDFGIASVDDETATRGDLIGTLGYVAPERFEGEPATPQSDVFAAAAVLLEALTGRQPHRAETAAATIERLRAGDHDPVPDGTPPRLRDIVERGLDPDPSRRPVDAAAASSATPPPTDEALPTTTPLVADATQRLDATEHLAPPAPTAPATRGITVPAPRPAVAERLDTALSTLRKPQVVFVVVTVVLLVLLVLVATGGDDGSPAGEPAPDDPRDQLDQNLDRIEEIGR